MFISNPATAIDDSMPKLSNYCPVRTSQVMFRGILKCIVNSGVIENGGEQFNWGG